MNGEKQEEGQYLFATQIGRFLVSCKVKKIYEKAESIFNKLEIVDITINDWKWN